MWLAVNFTKACRICTILTCEGHGLSITLLACLQIVLLLCLGPVPAGLAISSS